MTNSGSASAGAIGATASTRVSSNRICRFAAIGLSAASIRWVQLMVRMAFGNSVRSVVFLPHAVMECGGLVFQERPDDLDRTLPGGKDGAAGQIQRRILRVIAGDGF